MSFKTKSTALNGAVDFQIEGRNALFIYTKEFATRNCFINY